MDTSYLLELAFRQFTKDPVLAGELTDKLGPDSFGPRAGFSPDWVLASLKKPAAFAAYALLYCRDVPTLRLGALDRRFLVQLAVANNPYADQSVREALRNSPTLSTNPRLTTLLEHTFPLNFTTRLEAILTHAYRQPEHRHAVPGTLSPLLEHYHLTDPATTPARVNQLLIRAAQLGFTQLVREYFSHYYARNGYTTPGIAGYLPFASVLPEDLLTALPPHYRSEVLAFLAAEATRTYFHNPITVPVAEFLERYAGRDSIGVNQRFFAELPVVFDEPAFDYLMEHPRWHRVLLRSRLSSDQAHRLYKVISLALCTELLSYRRYALEAMDPNQVADSVRTKNFPTALPSTRAARLALLDVDYSLDAVFEALYTYAQSHDVGATTPIIERLLGCIETVDDPRIARVVSLLDSAGLANFVQGDWFTSAHQILPSPASLPGLAASLGDKLVSLSDPLTIDIDANEPYQHALLNHVPGAAPLMLRNDLSARIIVDRLEATAVDPRLAMKQFHQATHHTLADLERTLRALARTTTSSCLPEQL